ncbi:superoxide dismutase family protein [Riemerella anatipestifer]|uniref:Superoxide dismutase copper/zinc binding protein n=1 Tax=Riemerella anatipestifer (strain ATCC 11845 / DSM 15868 / JCM 9532 / NCTC 11014) TaxID=693978 RepID=E4TA86_RIEAD|nr:superoxide dismutase family protein [Riemerella anatipestifer]ADQ82246.1 superoxide dismutase copper/zinc binding protein [Riemerella anatipestifer ATCC 11845 = DSM 15868]ADZ12251.1 Cu/Zn superoxide dismutase [Riemerella anatipestifer RA-GD]AFD56249.1 superoxide dismutase copper/zinc binding protein [Riemerella anatipestifer ATCC 11845 = DSM 15868]AGC39830.1 hypothetical protein G148_0526 [Riemerella anatipestifer RA-CH-2]AKP69452.1 superoxide dismutase copper/zinc binding protein [Riemerel
MKKLSLLLGSVFALTSCVTSKTYTIQSKSNTNTKGTATFTQKAKTVTLNIDVHNLTPGKHAIHIHEFGDCSAKDGSSAGGHWNPTGHHHGKWETEHFHRGDIGNLNADKNGHATLTFSTDKWCLGCKDETKNLYNKSIIIHAGEDDYRTQPTGNAGGRVGCVEIKK